MSMPCSATLCPMQWFDPAPTEAELDAFVAGLGPHHAGMGIQSFIAMDAERFRTAARQAASVPA